MKSLISKNPIQSVNPQFPLSNFLFHFPSFSRENRRFWHYYPRVVRFSSIRATCGSGSASYGGWDDPRLVGDLVRSGESEQFRNFLVSFGIDDRKHVFMFLLGLVCALAISRVRVSSIIVFPASVLVFAIGFSVGFVRGGNFSEFNFSENNRKAKDDYSRAYSGKLRNLAELFDRVNEQVSSLKECVQRAISSSKITVSDLENYVTNMEELRLKALNARSVVTSIDNVGKSNGVSVGSQDLSRRRKEIGEVGFDLWHIVKGLLGQNVFDSKPTKLRENVRREAVDGVGTDQTQANSLTSKVEKSALNSVFPQGSYDKSGLDKDKNRKTRVVPDNGSMNIMEMGESNKRFIDDNEYSFQNKRFMDKNGDFTKRGHKYESESQDSQDNLLDYVDFHVTMNRVETKASFVQEQMLKNSTGAYTSSRSRHNTRNKTYRSQFREERVTREDTSSLVDHMSAHTNEVGSSSSSYISDDVLFDRYLKKSNNLLKQAKESMRDRCDEEQVEMTLYKSSKLLSKAISMKPMSLLAVGQLGNTYLLHGELKLKISRELRSLLSTHDPVSVEKWSKLIEDLDNQLTSKEKIASILINVCEECEDLLVEAGRKYRKALSIDGNDVRALYNWGLALFFRAQLIADIGQEAASDADKVFLAAIDKFDAMMSKGNVYNPDALFRWGMVLQQRSRLRPSNSREKVKLLQQAKRLYEDALNMESDNPQVREALYSCVSELDFR